MKNFELYRAHCSEWVENGISRYLEARSSNEPILDEAMHYVVSGGKRVRAMLLHAACLLAEGNPDKALPAACAIEFVHAYSLVHDDLPAMDDADLRRGKLSCHKKYGEAVAILAGDALQAFAFEVLSTTPLLSPEKKIFQLATLAKAIGLQGMVAGQSMELSCSNKINSVEKLEEIYMAKTGALICASLIIGASSGGHVTSEMVSSLSSFGRAISLAFQVQDDILDVVGDPSTLGKPIRADEKNNKVTFVSLMGLEEAYGYVSRMLDIAFTALEPFSKEAEPLKSIMHYTISRSQ